MKKVMMICLVLLGAIFLSSCEINRFSEFNKRAEEIEFEETGYIFFTAKKYIDQENEYQLENIFKEVLENNDVTYEYVRFTYGIIENVLFTKITYGSDEDDNIYQAIVMYDFLAGETIYFELLEPRKTLTYSSNYQFHIDKWGNILLYSMYDATLSIYTIDDHIIYKEVFDLPMMDTNLWYIVKEGLFIRYIIEEAKLSKIDTFDYINKENYEGDIGIDDIDLINGYMPPYVEINQEKHTYYVDSTTYKTLTITDENNQVIVNEEILSLYEQSNAGKKINDIFNDLEFQNLPEPEYRYIFTKDEIYITFEYNQGFLLNRSLLGQTKYFIFRVDIETKTLKYIGLKDDILTIYKHHENE